MKRKLKLILENENKLSKELVHDIAYKHWQWDHLLSDILFFSMTWCCDVEKRWNDNSFTAIKLEIFANEAERLRCVSWTFDKEKIYGIFERNVHC